MKTTPTFAWYISRSYLVNFVFLALALLAIIYLFDSVELIRRANKHESVPLSFVLQMSLLKLPEVGQVLLPFAVLFSAMFTFWQLNRRSEIIVIRAAGFSVWQFLGPVLIVACLTGLFQISVINPAGALLLEKFEELERRYLSREPNQIALFKEGLWLRQGTGNPGEYLILHADRINQKNWTLQTVSALFFDAEDRFFKRVDAKTATLDQTQWVLRDVAIHDFELKEGPLISDSFVIPTSLTISDVEESFASPQTMSFWSLPGHIQTLEETGFDSSRLRVHYHTLLAQPLFFMAMILLAATVSLRPPRLQGTGFLIGLGVFIGFFVFFFSSFLQAMGTSQKIPVILAAWSPAFICLLLGVSVIMALEDG